MKKKILFYFVLEVVLSLSACSKGNSDDALAALIANPPVISSVTPQIGTPRQNNDNGIYPPTEVVIKGSNFGIDTVVRFNEIQSTISANLGTELYTSVPDGAYSGFITVSKSGGSCPAGTSSGFNCAGTDFFIDCYQAAGNQYGTENEIKQGESKSIEFSGTETKAFRTDVIFGNANLTITCESIVTVRLFNRSCLATDFILQRDPTVPLPSGYTSQFYLTAGSATCTVKI
jgi:hypothetical protein